MTPPFDIIPLGAIQFVVDDYLPDCFNGCAVEVASGIMHVSPVLWKLIRTADSYQLKLIVENLEVVHLPDMHLTMLKDFLLQEVEDQ